MKMTTLIAFPSLLRGVLTRPEVYAPHAHVNGHCALREAVVPGGGAKGGRFMRRPAADPLHRDVCIVQPSSKPA